jgi:hypothetical protein
MEKMNMDKRIDQLKKLQDQLADLKWSKEVSTYLELSNTISSLRGAIKNDTTSHIIIKPNGFGVRQTLKEFKDEFMIGTNMTANKKTFSGILLGENVNAHIKLTHKSAYEVQASTLMKIEGWTS